MPRLARLEAGRDLTQLFLSLLFTSWVSVLYRRPSPSQSELSMPAHDRPLYLHISALSPDEFELYTNVLSELAGPGQDDAVWDRPVDVMEARGWVRGRYGLDASMVDKVCSLLDVVLPRLTNNFPFFSMSNLRYSLASFLL